MAVAAVRLTRARDAASAFVVRLGVGQLDEFLGWPVPTKHGAGRSYD